MDLEVLSVSQENNASEHQDVEESMGELIMDKEQIKQPEVGMKFKENEEIFELFSKYAYAKGFAIRKRTKVKAKDGNYRYVTFSCSREGKKVPKTITSLNPRPNSQTGCKVKVAANFGLDGYWKISKVILDHNHEISPTRSRFFRCNRVLSKPVQRQLDLADKAGIPPNKNFQRLVVEAGGYSNLPFLEKDARNFFNQSRRLRLGEGDAIAIHRYFWKMTKEDTGFFFKIDLDKEDRLKNIFWADGRSRKAYKEFSEVVTFDTTYLTNKYEMPFAPFVGVNHHGQSIFFGFGLISGEDTQSFIWLFEAWLECMDNVAPGGIITDQDLAMRNAIELVFPNTRHRWCLWHIMKKIPQKLGSYTHYDSIRYDLQRLVYDTHIPIDFEYKWGDMVQKYDLYQCQWLGELYIERERWVPCYLKTTFWAGMSSTQRSEGVNAFFDGYVNSKTTLKQFVEQCESASKRKIENETLVDFKSFSQMVPCTTRLPMEKQIQSIYTISKFKEFQEEFTGQLYCRLISTRETYFGMEYDIREEIMIGEYVKKMVVTVLFIRSNFEVECTCHAFEFKGILCKHAIFVLLQNDISLLPDKYILRRWRKDVCRCHSKMGIGVDALSRTVEQSRYYELSHKLDELANLASENVDHFVRISKWVENEMKMHMIIQPSDPNASKKTNDTFEESGGNNTILDPLVTARKGRPRVNRLKPTVRMNKKKMKASTT